MKITTLLILILFFAVVTKTFSQQVVELKLPKSEKIVIKLMFKNGSVCDPAGKEGLTNLTASLITNGGTKDMTYQQIQEKLFPMAASYNVNVDKEVTIFTFQVPKFFLNDFYPILKGIILSPAFDEKDFERVKSNVLNYLDQGIRGSSDEEYSKKLLEYYLFDSSSYQHMVQGKSESVNNITLDNVKDYYTKYFKKYNLTIGIAGNYSPEFLETLKTDMQSLSYAYTVFPSFGIVLEPLQKSSVINVEIISKDEAFGSAIFMGFPMNITRRNDDFAALMVANSYLGEHRKSYGVLYNKLRETRSMNYGDYSYIEWYDNGGGNMLPPPGVPRSSNYFSLWIRPVQIAKQLKKQYPELSDIKIGHAHFAIRLAVREVEKLVKNGMTKEDFEATREFLKSYIKLYVQTPAAQLGYLMDSKFYGRTDYISEMGKLLDNLTLNDVNKAIKKYWSTDNIIIAIVTDKSEAEELANSIKNNLPSPMSYSNFVREGLPKEVLAEDEEVANYKLNINSVTIINSKDTFK
jgi:zinc protease